MKQYNAKFLLSSIATIIIFGIMSACSSAAEKNAGEKPAGEAAQSSHTETGKASNSNKLSENKAENKNTEETNQNDSVKVYDGRTPMTEAKLLKATKTDEEAVRAEYKAKEAEIKQKFGDQYSCEESDVPDITGVGKGAFTKPNASQEAFAYTVCSTGSSQFGVGGIMIFENDKIVSHYVYGENGLLNGGVFTLPDINKNGLTEFVLMDGQMHQGYSSEAIEILEFKDGNLNDLGGISVGGDNSGAAENDANIVYNASNVSVKTAENPTFNVVEYERKGKSKEWVETKKSETKSLEKHFGKNHKIS